MEQNELTAQIVLEYERVISDFVNIVREAQQAAAAITETFNTAFGEINKSIEKAANTIQGLNKVTEGTTQQWRKAGLSVRSFLDLVKIAAVEIIKLANPIDLVVGGFKGLLSVLSDIIVTIGRIRVTINTLFKGLWTVVKAPFALVTKALDFLRSGLEKVFKAFEWFQYQLFMQFMNIWLVLKVFGPLLDSFMDYNREIYNAWSLINDEMEETSYRLTVMGNELTNIVDIMNQAGLSLAVKFGETPLNVAKAFYDALSAGIAVSDMFYTVEQSMKAARAGVTSVDIALKGGIQAMYAFGLSARNLTEIFDAQFEAVKIGIIRYEELVSVMGRVYQSAASLGGQMERLKETYYSIAFLTRVGLSPEMGAFGLARLYEELANPDTIRALEELGVRAYDLRGEFRGLLPVIKDLTNSLAGFSTEAQERMLTAVGFDMRAIRVLRAMVNNFAEFSRIAQQYEQEVGGAMESAYEKQIKAVSFAMERLKASWEAFKISVVDASSDAIQSFTEIGISLLNAGSMIIKKYDSLLSNFAKFASLFYGSFAILALVAGVVRGLLTPFGLLSSAFAVLIYQAQQGTEFFEAFSERFPLLGEAVRIAAIGIQQFVDAFTQGKLELIPTIFMNITNAILGLFAQVPSIQRLRDAILDFYNNLMGFIQGIDTITIPVLARKFGNILRAIANVIKDAIISLFGLEDFEGTITDFVRKMLVVIYDSIMEMFSGIFGTEHRMTLPDLLLEFGVVLGLYIKTPEGKYRFNAAGVSEFILTVLEMALENVLRILRGWDFVLLIAELKFVFSAIKLLLGGQLISTITRAAGAAGQSPALMQLLQKIGFGIKAGTAAFLVTDIMFRLIPGEFQEWMQKHRTVMIFVELALAVTAITFIRQIGALISRSVGTQLFPILVSVISKAFPWALLGAGVIYAITKLASILGDKTQEQLNEAFGTVYDSFMEKVTNIEQIRAKVGKELSVVEAATLVAYKVLEEEHDETQKLIDIYREEKAKVVDDINAIRLSRGEVTAGLRRAGMLEAPKVSERAKWQSLGVKMEGYIEELKQQGYEIKDTQAVMTEAARNIEAVASQSTETVVMANNTSKEVNEILTTQYFPEVHALVDQIDTLSRSTNEHVKQLLVSDQELVNDIQQSVEGLVGSVRNMRVEDALEKISKIRAQITELKDKFENQYKEIRKTDPQIDSTLETAERNLNELNEKITKVQIGLMGDISLFLRNLAESMGIALDTDLEQQAELTAEEIKRRFIEGATNIVERAFGERLWRSIFEGFLLNIQDIFDISIGELGEVTIGAYKYEPSEVAAKRAITSLVSFAQQNFGASFKESTGMLFDDVFNKTIIEPMTKFINSVREQIENIADPDKRSEVTALLSDLENTVVEIQKAIAEGAWEDVRNKTSQMLDLAYKTLSETDKKRLQEFGELVKNIDNMFIQYGDDFIKIMKNMLHIKVGGAETVRAVLYMVALKAPEAVKDLLDKFVNGQKAVLSAIEDMRSTVEEQENQMVNDILKELLGISIEIEEIPSVEATEWQAIAEFAMQNLSAEVLKQLKELLGIQEDNIKALALGLQQGYEEGLTIVKDLVRVYYSSKAVEASKKLLGSLIRKYFGQEDILQSLALEAGLTPQDELKKAMDDFISQFEDLYNEGNEIVVKYVDDAKAMYDELQRMIQAGEIQGEELDKSIKGFIGFLQLLTYALQRSTKKISAEETTSAYKDIWQKWQDQVQNVLDNQINFAQIFVEQILETGFDLEDFVEGLGTTQEELLKVLQAQGYAKPDETLLGALRRQVREGNRDIIDFVLGSILKPTISRLLGDVIKVLHESGTDILAELIAGISREEFDKELEDARRRAEALMEKNKVLSAAILRSLDDIEAEANRVGGNFAAAAVALIKITSILDIVYNVEENLLSDIKNRLEQTRSRLQIEVDYLSQGFDQISFTTQDIAALIDVYGEDFKEWIRKLAEKHEIAVTDIVETAKVLAQEDASIAQEMEELLEPIWRRDFLKSLQEVYAEHGLELPTEIDSVKRDINNQLNEIRNMLSEMSEQDRKSFEQELEALQDEYIRLESIVSTGERLFQLKEFSNHLSGNVLPRAREARNNWNDVLNKQKQLQNSVDQKLRDLESIKLNIEEIFNIPLNITDKVVEEVRSLFTPEEWEAVWGEVVAYKELDVAKLQKLAEIDPKAKEMLKNIIKKRAKEQVQADLEALAESISDEGKRALAEAFGIDTLDVLKVKLQRYKEEYESLLPPESKRRADYGKILQHWFDKMEEAIKQDQLIVAQEYATMIEEFLQFIRGESEDTASEIQSIDYTQIRENYEKISDAISNALDLLRTALQKGYDFIIEKFGGDITNLIDGFKFGVSQGYMSLMDQITETVEMAVTKETTATLSERLVTESGQKAIALAQKRIESLLYTIDISYTTALKEMSALAQHIENLQNALTGASDSDRERIKAEIERAQVQYKALDIEVKTLDKVYTELLALAKGEIKSIDDLSQETKAFLIEYGTRLRDVLRIERFEEAYINLKNALKNGLYTTLNNFLDDLRRAFADVRDEMNIDDLVQEQLSQISRSELPLIIAKLSDVVQDASSDVVSQLVDQYTSDLDKLLSLAQVRGRLTEGDVRETLTNVWETWRTSFSGILSTDTLNQIKKYIDRFIAEGQFDVISLETFVTTLRGYVYTELETWIQNNFEAIRKALEAGDISQLTDEQKKFLLVLFDVYGAKIKDWVSETQDAIEGVNFRGIFDPETLFGTLENTVGQINMDFVQWLRDFQVDRTSKIDYIMESLSDAIDIMYVQLSRDITDIQKKYGEGTQEWIDALQSLSEKYGVEILDPQTKKIKELSKAEFVAVIRAHVEELLEILSREGEITEAQLTEMGSWVIPLLKLLQAIFGDLAEASQDIAEMLKDLDFDRFISRLRTVAFDVQDMKQELEQIFTEMDEAKLSDMIGEYANTAIEVLAVEIMDRVQNLRERYSKDTTKFKQELARLSQEYGVDLVTWLETYGADQKALQNELRSRFDTEWATLRTLLEQGNKQAIISYLMEHQEFAQFIIDAYQRNKEQINEAERELQEQQQAIRNAFTGFLDSLTDFLTTLGNTFPSMQDATSKIVQAINIISNTATRMMELQAAAQTALASQNLIGTAAGSLGWVGVGLLFISGLMQIFNLFNQSQEQETEVIQNHLSALERNTVALEALTDILSRMRATLYNAPSEFGYAFVPAPAMTPAMAPAGVPASVTVTINVNGQGGIPDSDIDRIARAVESSVRRVY